MRRHFRQKRSVCESVNAALRRNCKISGTSSNRISVSTRRHLRRPPIKPHARTQTNFGATVAAAMLSRPHPTGLCRTARDIERARVAIGKERKPEPTGTVIYGRQCESAGPHSELSVVTTRSAQQAARRRRRRIESVTLPPTLSTIVL